MTTVPGGFDPADDPYREWDAAYVLGALAPAERREYERHLAACDACRTAVGEIAGIPGVLRAVAPQERAALLAPGDGHDDGAGARVVPLAGVAAAARRSRARRRTLLAAAAAALVAGGVTGGVGLAGGFEPGGAAGTVPVAAPASTGTPEAGTRTLVLRPVGGTDVHAELTATSTAWGTRLDWRCRYPSPPSGYGAAGATGSPGAAAGGDADGAGRPVAEQTYELVIVDSAGARTVVATWTAEGLEAEGLGASSAVPLDDVQRVEIAVGGREEPLAVATL
jgi:anti-sigma factor RsiW